MIPYPGESLGAFDAANGTDHSLALDVIYRGSFYGTTPGTATLAAGDVWRAWVASGTADYLEEDGLDLDVSWVVEVVSGTVTFTAGEANDPDYGDDTLAPSSTLGTFTVTGPATVVIPSGFTGSDIYNAADDDLCFMLHLSASAGSAVVQQVKLRAWPQGGPLGAWSDTLDGFDTAESDPGMRALNVVMTGGVTAVAGAEAAWDAAVDAFHADATSKSASQSRAFGTTALGANVSQSMAYVDTDTYAADTTVRAELRMILGKDWATEYPIGPGFTEGVDWVRPPEEVWGDQLHYAQQVGTGSTGWSNASVYIESSSDEVPGSFTVAAEAGEWVDEDAGSGHTYTMAVTTGGAAVEGQNALPTSGRMIRVAISHTAVSGDADEWPGWVPTVLFPRDRAETASRYFGDVATLTPIKTFAVMPPYKVWDPNAVPETVAPLKLITRRDALGMGSGALLGADTRQNSIRLLSSP